MRNIDYFDKSAGLYPDRAVLKTAQGAITYAAMQRMTHRLAGAMAAAGLQPQEAVAIMSPNHPGVLTAMLSLWRAGAVWIPVNTRNALPDTIAYLRYVRAGWLFYHSSLSAEAHEAARQVPSIRHLICLDAPDAGNPCLDGFMLPADAPDMPDLGSPDGGDRELCAIIATGGTTGPAKGVRALNRSWGTMLESIAMLMAVEEIPVFLATAPLSHAAGPFALAGIAISVLFSVLFQIAENLIVGSVFFDDIEDMFNRRRLAGFAGNGA
ncbi:class I adenylate-forming enzyme family protein [Novosphingobium sp. SCN 63-17]|uniref:class I adenylate-forming enzyme family protein n=1 Tax=Novosphingobium sp. SCN 63-17 TaxID=1660120 RepID=UPI000868BD3C|nr:class I adenylate-forming enzyme family protein [Novosphingobium sp. SCN 63-17]ODU77769.1 MAG: hypothetical protein ABT10_23930 [Novosphingobium sp. SCN 63-17]